MKKVALCWFVPIAWALGFLNYSEATESAVDVGGQLSRHNLCLDEKGCVCKVDLAKLRMTPPPGMSLVSACDITEYDSSKNFFSGQGVFYFKGETTLHGVVSAERPGEAGDFYFFRQKYSVETNIVYSLLFDDLRIGPSKMLKFPALSTSNNCWSADAVIKVRLLRVVVSERDDAGNYPEKLDVLQLGKFNKCKL